MDGPTAFRILKYKVLEPYFQKNGLQSSEIQSEVITSFLDWILGPQFGKEKKTPYLSVSVRERV